jgi:hypothetical protein
MRMRKSLDTVSGRHYLTDQLPGGRWFSGNRFNPHEEHMGSITFGNANPTIAIGSALPPDIKINRDGFGRVRVVVATS